MGIEDYCKTVGFNLTNEVKLNIEDSVRKSGFEVINKKGATYYAIALAVIRVIECIIRDEKSILTVSSLINGEYGVENVALSLPSLVSKEGVVKTLELKLNDDEIRTFRESANIIKKITKEVGF